MIGSKQVQVCCMTAQDHPLTRAAMNDSEWPKSQVCCSSYCGCACAYCRYQVSTFLCCFQGFSCENYRQNSSGSNLKVEGLCGLCGLCWLCHVVSIVDPRARRISWSAEGSANPFLEEAQNLPLHRESVDLDSCAIMFQSAASAFFGFLMMLVFV